MVFYNIIQYNTIYQNIASTPASDSRRSTLEMRPCVAAPLNNSNSNNTNSNSNNTNNNSRTMILSKT